MSALLSLSDITMPVQPCESPFASSAEAEVARLAEMWRARPPQVDGYNTMSVERVLHGTLPANAGGTVYVELPAPAGITADVVDRGFVVADGPDIVQILNFARFAGADLADFAPDATRFP